MIHLPSVEARRGLRPLCHVLSARAHGVVGRGEVALVEGADLVGSERADDGVQDAAVVEEDEVLLVPVVWVDELRTGSAQRSEEADEADLR